MPIPTDTFWNIKRLNWIFAVSAIVLFAVTAWSILQDHEKSWRVKQRQGRVWDAALTSERIESVDSDPERTAEMAALKAEIAAAERDLEPKRQDVARLENEIKDLV